MKLKCQPLFQNAILIKVKLISIIHSINIFIRTIYRQFCQSPILWNVYYTNIYCRSTWVIEYLLILENEFCGTGDWWNWLWTAYTLFIYRLVRKAFASGVSKIFRRGWFWMVGGWQISKKHQKTLLHFEPEGWQIPKSPPSPKLTRLAFAVIYHRTTGIVTTLHSIIFYFRIKNRPQYRLNNPISWISLFLCNGCHELQKRYKIQQELSSNFCKITQIFYGGGEGREGRNLTKF